MNAVKSQLSEDDFYAIRKSVLASWATGKGLDLEAGIDYQLSLPSCKSFAAAMKAADQQSRILIQPRAGVALLEEQIALLQKLQEKVDLLPTTIDAYTRNNNYTEAAKGMEKSQAAGHSFLNGFPAVNYGLSGCKQIIEAVNKPVQVRHGTPDARLLAEITLAAGFSAFEGGGISYNIPYSKKIPLAQSIRDWQYVDRLTGIYEKSGVRINREPFGPLSGTLVPPFISHTVAILEGILALEQGVKSLTLGYGQAGNLVQDIAAIISLRDLAHETFHQLGFGGYELTTVFHQWMGGFPENEAKALAVISWGGIAATMAGATKVITKTPHEAMGIPTTEANLQGIAATRQVINMLKEQERIYTPEIHREVDIIKHEVRALLDYTLELGNGDVSLGSVRAFEVGVIDVPFAPSVFNCGKMLPVRDNNGAVRVLEKGNVPLPKDIFAYHQEKINTRAAFEKRQPCFQMVIDDIYAISKGKLVGRPK